MRRIDITLPFPPSANRYWRVFGSRVVKSPEARRYIANVRASYAVVPMDGPVEVRLEVYRPARRGDLDNRLKVLLDALSGVAYLDDSQVRRIVATQHEAPGHGRIEVTITQREES